MSVGDVIHIDSGVGWLALIMPSCFWLSKRALRLPTCISVVFAAVPLLALRVTPIEGAN